MVQSAVVFCLFVCLLFFLGKKCVLKQREETRSWFLWVWSCYGCVVQYEGGCCLCLTHFPVLQLSHTQCVNIEPFRIGGFPEIRRSVWTQNQLAAFRWFQSEHSESLFCSSKQKKQTNRTDRRVVCTEANRKEKRVLFECLGSWCCERSCCVSHEECMHLLGIALYRWYVGCAFATV